MKQVLSFSNKDLLYEDRKLSEVALINPSSMVPSEFEYVDLESVSGTEMIRHRLEHKETAPSRAQRLAKRGDIFYQTVRPYQKNNYFFDMDEDNYVFSTGYAQIRPQINGKYLFTLLQSDAFLGQVLDYCAGTSFPAINPSILSNLLIRVCTNQQEQELIAKFFVYYDNIISTASSRLASLKQVKEASLQAMFPQKGETVPKIRFKGFEGEWEEVLLGSLFSERVENDVTAEMLSVTMHDGIIKANENGRYDNSNSDRSNYKLVLKDDIAYNTMRMWQGASGCSPYSRGIVSPAYTVITPNVGVCSVFFAFYFKTNGLINKFRLNSQGLTKDTWNLKYPAFSSISVLYPTNVLEQQRIASYFTSLDKQIALQTQRLEKLKQIKAACLDKMFV